MKNIAKITAIILVATSTVLTVTSCKKKAEEPQMGSMTVEMTDAPGPYTSVNVEVVGVSVNLENVGWVDLATNAGVYDLLSLQNNVTTVLSNNVSLPLGKINQVRLKLGSNNSVVTSAGTFPLATPSAEESGLKINLDETIVYNQLVVVVLDFDANASIVVTGNNTYSLKPVIKVKSVTQI